MLERRQTIGHKKWRFASVLHSTVQTRKYDKIGDGPPPSSPNDEYTRRAFRSVWLLNGNESVYLDVGRIAVVQISVDNTFQISQRVDADGQQNTLYDQHCSQVNYRWSARNHRAFATDERDYGGTAVNTPKR